LIFPNISRSHLSYPKSIVALKSFQDLSTWDMVLFL
jgi:hypothetical protein